MKKQVKRKISVDQILSLLPQTQCQKCGYNSCFDYAKAITKGAPINCCPTGGEKGIKRLCRLTKKTFIPLNPVYGKEQPQYAVTIDESLCVGCELCIKACPVDAIIGSHGLAHSVLIQQCTGCDLCIKACPVDCIIPQKTNRYHEVRNSRSDQMALRARINYEQRQKRLENQEKKQLQSESKKEALVKRKNIVAAAIEKARKKMQVEK